MPASVQDQAREALKRGRHLQMTGRFDEALACFRKSIALSPTPEAHTSLAWVLSCLGRYEEAIGECRSALALDPECGNACNDIGAYLLELGRHREAVPWLRRACFSPQYKCRHYAHFNLGRAYETVGQWREAIAEYSSAVAAQPQYAPARRALTRLQCQMN
jgi:Tfp pilus assembly protein PilF